MGSSESHFNVLLIVEDKVARQCPQTITFEEKGEPVRSDFYFYSLSISSPLLYYTHSLLSFLIYTFKTITKTTTPTPETAAAAAAAATTKTAAATTTTTTN